MACQGKEGLVEPYSGAVKRWQAKAWRVWWNPTVEELKGGMEGRWNPTVEPFKGGMPRYGGSWWKPTMEQLKGGTPRQGGSVEPYNGAVKRCHAKVWRVWWNSTMEQLKGGMPRQGGSGGTLQWSS